MNSYSIPEIQKAKIAVSVRERGLEKMARRHADERLMKELELKAAKAYLAILEARAADEEAGR